MTRKKLTVIRYTGNGAIMQGIPARDLTPEEWEAIDPETRRAAVAADLYVAADVDAPDLNVAVDEEAPQESE